MVELEVDGVSLFGWFARPIWGGDVQRMFMHVNTSRLNIFASDDEAYI